MNQQKGIISIAIVVALLLVLGAGIYLALNWQSVSGLYKSSPKQSVTPTPTATPSKSPSPLASPIPTPAHTGSISISVSAAPTTIAQGSNLTITWEAKNAPANSAVVLELFGPDGQSRGWIGSDLLAKGSRVWKVPPSNCTTDQNGFTSCSIMGDNPNVSATEPGVNRIVARLYTPAGGLGGGLVLPSKDLTYLATSESFSFTIK